MQIGQSLLVLTELILLAKRVWVAWKEAMSTVIGSIWTARGNLSKEGDPEKDLNIWTEN